MCIVFTLVLTSHERAYLVGVVVACVVEVVADCRGQHGQQIDAVHLTPQVCQPDQTIHLLGHEEAVKDRNDDNNKKDGSLPKNISSAW